MKREILVGEITDQAKVVIMKAIIHMYIRHFGLTPAGSDCFVPIFVDEASPSPSGLAEVLVMTGFPHTDC